MNHFPFKQPIRISEREQEAFDNWIEKLTGKRPEWKPITMPLIKMSDIKPIIIDGTKHKFEFAVPKKG